jgi:putative ABC transport system permease protein
MSSRSYDLILRCFPREFRVRHGAAMAAQFDEQLHATTHRPIARVGLWLRAAVDALRHGVALRIGGRRQLGRPSPLPNDLRQAWRSLRSRPGHALTSVGLLAVALSVSTAVFAIVDAEILTPSPFPDARALVNIFTAQVPHHPDSPYLSPELARAWLARTDLFSAGGALAQGGTAVIGDDQTGRQDVGVAYFTPGLFLTLGVRPVAGRTFIDGEGQPGRDRLVVIGESIWRARFNRSPSAIGQTLVVNDGPATVIGVMPASFAFPFAGVKIWLPLDLAYTPASRAAEVTVRSRFGADHAALDDRVAAIASSVVALSGKPSRSPTAAVQGIDDVSFMTPKTKQSIVVLACATLLLLLTAAANLSTLTMTQMLSRTRQVAIQSALGASRARLVREALIEQLLIGLSGAALAVPLAWLFVRLAQTLGPTVFTQWTTHMVALDGRGVLVLGVLALSIPLLTGLVPALAGSRTSVVDVLKQDARAGTGGRGSRVLRRVLVTTEIVCAVVLLTAGALLVRSFLRLQTVDRGFDTHSLIYARLSFPARAFPSPLSRRLFVDQAVERLTATPGVAAATLTGGVPPKSGQTSFGMVSLDGQPETSRRITLPIYTVRPKFFAITGIPIVQGRAFAESELGTNAIVSESFAAAMWPGQSAVGHRYRLFTNDPWHEVVGVAGEVRTGGLDDARTSFEAYYPYTRQDLSAVSAIPDKAPGPYSGTGTVLVRAANASAVMPLVRDALTAIDRRVRIDTIEPVEDMYQESLAEPRMLLVLMALFSAAGLLVAGVGVYGVLSTLVAQQLREIGVRLMLGAEPSAMARRVFQGGLALAGFGTVVGIVAAVVCGRVLSSVLFDVRATDLASYVVVTVVIAVATITAAWLPARRAAKADPASLLRDN